MSFVAVLSQATANESEPLSDINTFSMLYDRINGHRKFAKPT